MQAPHPLHLLACIAVLPLASCESTPETPAPAPTSTSTTRTLPSFDRSFDAAVAAAKDVGIEVRSADRAGGRIEGTKAAASVTINVLRQASGDVRVGFSATGSPETNPTLNERWLSAYNRRMGR